MELYVRVRRACMVEGMSTHEAARVCGLHRDMVRKMLRYSVPPGYQRRPPLRRSKLDPYRGVIDRILEEDRSRPRKQHHTAKHIFERLRDEHGFPGKYTIVKDYLRERGLRTREMYVPYVSVTWLPRVLSQVSCPVGLLLAVFTTSYPLDQFMNAIFFRQLVPPGPIVRP